VAFGALASSKTNFPTSDEAGSGCSKSTGVTSFIRKESLDLLDIRSVTHASLFQWIEALKSLIRIKEIETLNLTTTRILFVAYIQSCQEGVIVVVDLLCEL
jgi:hypothetical protein